MCGGMINAISYLDLVGATFVSHLTGTSTKIGIRLTGHYQTPSKALIDKDAEEAATAYYAILLVVFFVTGSCISGCFIARNAVSVGRSAYGIVMLIAASLLFISVFFDLVEGFPSGSLLAAMACGIQNAMVTSYAGAVVRTTHVTGTWTDIGLMQGRMFANVLKNGLAMGPVDRAFLRADFDKWRILVAWLLASSSAAMLAPNCSSRSQSMRLLYLRAYISLVVSAISSMLFASCAVILSNRPRNQPHTGPTVTPRLVGM